MVDHDFGAFSGGESDELFSDEEKRSPSPELPPQGSLPERSHSGRAGFSSFYGPNRAKKGSFYSFSNSIVKRKPIVLPGAVERSSSRPVIPSPKATSTNGASVHRLNPSLQTTPTGPTAAAKHSSVNSVIPSPAATRDGEGSRPSHHAVSTPPGRAEKTPGRGEKTQTLLPTSLSTATTSQLHAKKRRFPSINYSSEESSDCEEHSDTRTVQVHKKCRSRDGSQQEVLQDTLLEVKQMLHLLCDKVERNERCLKELQNIQQSQTPSSSSSESSHKKRTIPLVVRQEVRKVYKTLIEEDDNFSGWHIGDGASIKSPENQGVITKLIRDVRGLNPSFDAHDIREAAYRFYKSKCEDDSIQRKGKAELKKTSRRRHERLTRKRKEREAAIMKNSRLTEDQRAKWLKVITNEYMSSEESGEDETIAVHPLPWRSEYVNQMFKKIDTFCNNKKSPQARRQMKQRTVGSPSSRPRPTTPAAEWAVQN